MNYTRIQWNKNASPPVKDKALAENLDQFPLETPSGEELFLLL